MDGRGFGRVVYGISVESSVNNAYGPGSHVLLLL